MLASMEYGLLGPLQVRREGVAVPIEAGRQRALLAALLLRSGRLVEADELAEVLWGSKPPRSPKASLHTHVARLRKVLGAAPGSPIVTEAGGYLIQVETGGLDVDRFEAALDEGRDAALAGDWRRSAEVLRDGLSLWRGEPLAGITSDALAGWGVTRLAELRLQALEARIDADLRLGRHRDVIAELREFAAAEPLRERVHGLLMMALCQDGQQAGALSAYQAVRRVLVEELGAEPGPELQDLHQRVLVGDVILSTSLITAEPGATSREQPAPPMRFSLPPDLGSFTGRRPELDQITASMNGEPSPTGAFTACVISGMPGIGKTALAVHAAHLLREKYPDGQLFVDLHGFTPGRAPVEPEAALAELLTAAGTSPRYLPADLSSRAAMWRDKMAGQRALLVLDNAVSSAQVAPLLPGASGCLVLVTSRRHLADLPGSALPVLMEVMNPDQASEMFIGMAPRATGEPDGAVAELMELAGFLPLAISLLARLYARHPSWTLADLATETRARMLTLTADEDSVAAAFEVSLHHQEPRAQELFAQLGLYPGGTFDAGGASALARATRAEAEALLDGLHTEGLILEVGYRRYELHDLVRQYAGQVRSISPAARQQGIERLLDYYQQGVTRESLAWARAERPALMECLDLVTRSGQHARVLALTASLADLLRRDGLWAEALSRHAVAVRAAQAIGDALGEAGALLNLGDARRMTGDLAGAAAAAREALAICHDRGHPADAARALESLGSALRLTADLQEAVSLLDKARAIYADTDDGLGQARCLHLLASISLTSGEHSAAVGQLQQARSLFAAADDLLGLANTLHLCGMVLLAIGDYREAGALLAQARATYAEIDDRNGIANSLHGLSSVRQCTGDLAGAAELLAGALTIYQELGSRIGQAHSLGYLGELRRQLGDQVVAGKMLDEALAIYRSMSNRQGEAETLIALGRLRRDEDDLARAFDCLTRALELARGIASSHDEAHALAELGRCALVQGDTALAADRLHRARDLFDGLGAPEAVTVAAELVTLSSASRT